MGYKALYYLYIGMLSASIGVLATLFLALCSNLIFYVNKDIGYAMEDSSLNSMDNAALFGAGTVLMSSLIYKYIVKIKSTQKKVVGKKAKGKTKNDRIRRKA